MLAHYGARHKNMGSFPPVTRQVPQEESATALGEMESEPKQSVLKAPAGIRLEWILNGPINHGPAQRLGP